MCLLIKIKYGYRIIFYTTTSLKYLFLLDLIEKAL